MSKRLIERFMSNGCWGCGYLSMTGISFVHDAVCLHREVQKRLLEKRKKYIQNVNHADACTYRSEQMDPDLRGESRHHFTVTVAQAIRRDREQAEAQLEDEEDQIQRMDCERQGSLF